MSARLLLACVLAFATPALLAQAVPPKKELSEKTGASLAQLRPLIEAKDHPAALALLETLLPAAKPSSFDAYVLRQIQAQLLLAQGKFLDAIPPLETALRLGEDNPSFPEPATIPEQLNLLAQLHYQRAAETKDVAAQKAGYETALGYARRRLQTSPAPTAEVRLFAASLLYQLATLDPAKPDAARIQEAITHAREGLLLNVHPSSQLLLILVACHLQLGENTPAAELLETLALRDPKSASTWAQLLSIYLAEAAETKPPANARRQNLRALLVLDRAQSAGLLTTPRDHYTRIAILFNLGQYARAAALLETRLADGSIENLKRNWELLASAYQQTRQEPNALATLARAAEKFPADAALEFSLAQLHYNTGNTPEAYARGRSALAKGLEKPGPSRVWLAYLADELQRYEEARAWLDAARASGDVPAATLAPLAAAIADALRNRQDATHS